MKHFLLSSIVALLFLGLIEFMLRVIHPEKVRNINYHGEVAYEFDEDYLMRLKKSVVKHYYRVPRNGGKKVTWTTNSQGFRGEELKREAKLRIVVYGDSNIQARFSEDEDTYVQKLQHFLSDSIPGVEVINAGVIGFGPDQALLKLKKEIPLLQPDIAIFNIFCDNDYGDLIRNRLFEIGKDDRFAPTKLEREPDNYLQYHKAQKKRFQLLIATEGRTFINRLFGEKEDPRRKENMIAALQDLCTEEFEIYRQSKPNAISHFRDHYDFDLAVNPESTSAQTKVRLMEGLLKEIKQTGMNQNVKIIIQIQPSVIDLTKNHIISHEDLASNPSYSRKQLTDIVRRICIENGMEYLDLFEVFQSQEASSCYFLHDDHWNDKGQEVAARKMAGLIIE